MKIILIVDGGLVQDIIMSEPAEVYLIDYDIESYDGKLCKIPQRKGKWEEAFATRRIDAEFNPARTNELAAVIKIHMNQP
jgi:hypothetical protein